MTVDPNVQVRYEHARANLWAAICKANPQLALPGLDRYDEVGEPVVPVEPRLEDGAEPSCAFDGADTHSVGRAAPPPVSPDPGGGSAPTKKPSAPAMRSSRDHVAGAN